MSAFQPLVVREFRYVDVTPSAEEKALDMVGDYIKTLEQRQELMLTALQSAYTCLRAHKLTGLPILVEYLGPALDASRDAIEHVTGRPA